MEQDAEVLKLLLAEKTYIDGRINSNLDLQHKVIAVGFAAMITALGWVLSTSAVLPPNSKVIIMLAIVSIGAIAALMAVAYGGFALGAMVYKEQVLTREFHRILRLDENVLRPVRAIRSAPVRRVFVLATTLLSSFHVILNLVLYVGALLYGEWSLQARVQWPLVGAAVLAGLLLLGSIVSLAIFYLAYIKWLRRQLEGLGETPAG